MELLSAAGESGGHSQEEGGVRILGDGHGGRPHRPDDGQINLRTLGLTLIFTHKFLATSAAMFPMVICRGPSLSTAKKI